MKKYLAILLLLVAAPNTFSQAAGNHIYYQQGHYREAAIDIVSLDSRNPTFTVRALANVTADSYVAVFAISQSGETASEVNTLMDERISSIKKQLAPQTTIECHADMISFVPMYELTAEKKMFSKKTYNEIPAGFEIKINLHVKYTKSSQLASVISACAAFEVYDLIRVDYFSSELEEVKKDLAAKAQTLLQGKIESCQKLLAKDFTGLQRRVGDGFLVSYPAELYRSYQAYSNSSLKNKGGAVVNQAERTSTLHYQPMVDKNFDFVVNAEVFEPVIQVVYEISLAVIIPEPVVAAPVQVNAEKTKEFILITANGEVKPLKLVP